MASEDQLFHQLLRLTGAAVEVGLLSNDSVLQGILKNTMPDSLILQLPSQEIKIISFQNLGHIQQIARGSAEKQQ